MDQIWPCRKIGQGQPRVIIWINLVVVEHPMPHTKFQGHRPVGSGEEDFLKFLPYMGMAAILVMWPGPFQQIVVPQSKGGFNRPSGFWGEDVWKCWRTHGRQRPAYHITHHWAFGSGELKPTIFHRLIGSGNTITIEKNVNSCIPDRNFLHTRQGFPRFSPVLTNLILHTLIGPVR